MLKQVIVTGGAGYIGSHTVVELAQAGLHPVIIDDYSNSSPDVLKGIEGIIGRPPEAIELDCAQTEALIQAFASIAQNGPIAGVIHFAAFKAVGESTEFPVKYFRNNVGTITALLEAMQHQRIANLVFSSSCTVYGQPDNIPVDESAPVLDAESPYGYTKQVCERLIRDVHASNVPLSAAILRYFNPIGAHASSLIGELPIGHPNNLIPYLTQATANLRSPLVVFGNDYPTRDGTCIRDYIHVVDLAKAHVAALTWLDQNEGACEAFNLGTGDGNTVMEVINTFEAVNGIVVPHSIGPRRPGDIAAIYANATKAKKVLGWSCQFGLEQALRDAWNWQQRIGQQ